MVNHLAVESNVGNNITGEKDLYGVYWADSEGNATTAEFNVTGGALKGYMTIRDGNTPDGIGIPYVVDLLNNVVKTVVEQINGVHSQGYTLPIGNEATRTGVNFFDPTCLTAKDMKVSVDILTNVNNIAASDMPVGVDGEENDQRGNNKIALKLVALINNEDENGLPMNLNSKYKEMLSAVSLEMKNIHSKTDSQTLMKAHVEAQRKSVSNVSLDEEMTNMVKFQHSYNAASRMINAMDEGLETIINKMGLVGRA